MEIFTETDRHYISLLQENINRMAANSANCKTWLLTLLSAITALQLAASDLRGILWIAPALILMFYYLDSYYLGLERKFRALEKKFITNVKNKAAEVLTPEIYSFNINSVTDKKANTWSALGSSVTWTFYLVLLLIVLVICLWPIISKWFVCNA